MTETLQVDNLTIEVRRSARRKHADLIVERDGGVCIAVPQRMGIAEVEQLVRARLTRLHTHLGRKREALSDRQRKEYVTGEGFHYLGRKYRLRLVDGDDAPLKLTSGRFVLPRRSAVRGESAFVAWYTQRGREWLPERVKSLQPRVAASPSMIEVRDLGYRWGSCSETGTVHFHWRVLLLPPKRIDYLILHELCHLHEHEHGEGFYRRLRRASPDYLTHEEWLRRHGDVYAL